MEADCISRLAVSGVIGAGGAGFPAHVKLNARADCVIINGAECEPLLRVDRQLMERYPAQLLEALELIVKQVGAGEGVVALKDHYRGAAAALERELPRFPGLRLHKLPSFYPAGDEHVLVCEVTGRIVPEGGIPLNSGAVVTNVETALNIRRALAEGSPVTHKYVTVTGAVRRPVTVRVPVGISVRQAVELAGGALAEPFAVINGGPMMGKLVPPDSPVTKTTKGLIVLPEDHPLIASLRRPLSRSLREAGAACMQCSQCSVTCPRGLLGHRLEPHKLMRVAAYGSTCDVHTGLVNAFLCSGCRLCEYACVMGLQPWKVNAFLKEELAKQGVRNPLHGQPEHPDPFRAYKRYPTDKLIRLLGLTGYDADAPLEEAEVPVRAVTLPLRQGAGVPAVPVVGEGDVVRAGALLAEIPAGKLGSCLHASIDGVVTHVTEDGIVLTACRD